MDSASRASQEIGFASAIEAAEAIRSKKISSVELTRLVFERIDGYNTALNAFVYQMRDEALAQAKKCDEATARGESLGAFHGVPINVKESFGVVGQPCTWGIPAFKDSRAVRNAAAVERLLGAGAVLLGGTNVPVSLYDWQSYNPIYGVTNNPWDLKRTPGGSSGGSAAAVAAGLGFLSVGSDIGGSIRVPAHYCGIYGHKPTLDLVSLRGHVGGGSVAAPGLQTLLSVAGPMARSAGDLMASMKVLGGPDGWDAKALKWEMPAARAKNLKEFRVGYVIDDPIAPPTPEVRAVLEKTIEALGRAGAQMKPGWPQGMNPKGLLDTYLYMLMAFTTSMAPPAQQPPPGAKAEDPNDPLQAGPVASYNEWQRANLRRLGYRALWQEYFKDVDVFLSPAVFTTAVLHDHSEPQTARRVATSAGPRKYMDIFSWIATATLTGCPATVAPVGLTAEGLPVDIQIMGPYWEDATPIAFAELMAGEIGGFAAPAGYSS
jgi:amidase